MEAASKESPEGVQLTLTPQEQRKDTGASEKDCVSPSENPKAELPLSSQTGAPKAGPCDFPQALKDSHPFSMGVFCSPSPPLTCLSAQDPFVEPKFTWREGGKGKHQSTLPGPRCPVSAFNAP